MPNASSAESSRIAAVHRLPSVTFGVMTKLVVNNLFQRSPTNWSMSELANIGVEESRASLLLADIIKLSATENTKPPPVDIVIITLNDPSYPPLLRQIPSPPPVLYVRGNIEVLRRLSLAVVGTRRPTSYGLTVTSTLLQPVVQAGVTIVSGLALGIDGQAHRVAVQHHVPTIAVLGCGIDMVYPWEHRQLADQIIAGGGAIISEFPLGAQPERHHFPQRNRIISGLCPAVLLVEAGAKSGALITAKFALAQNREVLAVPGPINSSCSIGPLHWIALGARPVITADDILDALGLVNNSAPAPSVPRVSTDPCEQSILQLLATGPRHIDDLARESRLDCSVVSASLSLLEIRGWVEHLGAMYYSLSP